MVSKLSGDKDARLNDAVEQVAVFIPADNLAAGVMGNFIPIEPKHLHIMRPYYILIFLSFLTANLSAQNVQFKHEWEMKYLETGIQFTSKKIAPAPFSTTGEPQALMTVGASMLDPNSNNSLKEIVKDEIKGIRESISLDEYLENDYKPDDNIVSYFEKIGSTEIAVIKYRTNGVKNKEKTMTRSVRQILLIKNNKLFVSSLIVLFAEDQDNMRSDQITFMTSIINH